MSKDIVIIGAGGFGREVKWLIERINNCSKKSLEGEIWNLKGFIDDALEPGVEISGLQVLCKVNQLIETEQMIHVVCAIGTSQIRKNIVARLLQNPNILFPNLIDPSVICSSDISLGIGNVVCAGTILTVDIQMKDFVILNLDCTIGHDVCFESYVTAYPSVNISGQVYVGEATELGTGSQIIQGKLIGKNVILGAGAVVTRDIPSECTAVGCPAKPINN